MKLNKQVVGVFALAVAACTQDFALPNASAGYENPCGVPLCITNPDYETDSYVVPLLHCEGTTEECLNAFEQDLGNIKDNANSYYERAMNWLADGFRSVVCGLFGESCQPGPSLYADSPCQQDLDEARETLGELNSQRDVLVLHLIDLESEQIPEAKQAADAREGEARVQVEQAETAATNDDAEQTTQNKETVQTELDSPDGTTDEEPGDDTPNENGDDPQNPEDYPWYPDLPPEGGDGGGSSGGGPGVPGMGEEFLESVTCNQACIRAGDSYCFEKCSRDDSDSAETGDSEETGSGVDLYPSGYEFNTPRGTPQWQRLVDARRLHSAASDYVETSTSYKEDRQALLDISDLGISVADASYADGNIAAGDGLMDGVEAMLDTVFNFENILDAINTGTTFLAGLQEGIFGIPSRPFDGYERAYFYGQAFGSVIGIGADALAIIEGVSLGLSGGGIAVASSGMLVPVGAAAALEGAAMVAAGSASATVHYDRYKDAVRNLQRTNTGQTPSGKSVHSSRKLGKNLKESGFQKPTGDPVAAHHMAPGGKFGKRKENIQRLVKNCRKILDDVGIDINDAENGVWLPDSKNSSHPGIYHRELHTNTYVEEVHRRLSEAAGDRDAVIQVLNRIRKDLLEKDFPY